MKVETYIAYALENVLFLGAVLAVFAAGGLLAWFAIITIQRVMDQYKNTFTETASANMADMFMFVDATRLFYINLGALIVLPLLLWLLTGDVFVGVVVFFILLILPPYIYRRMRKQRLKRFEAQLPDGLLMVTGSLRAGASIQMAFQGLVKEFPAPMSQEFELLVREQRIGTDFDVALDNMQKRLPLDSFSMLVSALKISREVGGNLTETLETLAETLRRKAQMEGKIDSLTSQGRMQALVMTGLPVVLLLVLTLMEPEAMSVMFNTPLGWMVLGFIIFWEGIGFFFIRKIVSIEV